MFSLLAHMVITIVIVKGNVWIPNHQNNYDYEIIRWSWYKQVCAFGGTKKMEEIYRPLEMLPSQNSSILYPDQKPNLTRPLLRIANFGYVHIHSWELP